MMEVEDGGGRLRLVQFGKCIGECKYFGLRIFQNADGVW